MLSKEAIINDLNNYYSDDEFKGLTGFSFNDIPDNELQLFFEKHCQKNKVTISIKDLYDNYGDSCFLINTPDGFKEVGSLYLKSKRRIFSVSTKSNKIKCSEDHYIETPKGWIKTETLKKGDLILTKDGYQEISSIKKLKDDIVYDLEVLSEEHRYWGGTGISSHNTGKSFLAVSICREAQKKGYTPVYMDSEGAIDIDFVSRLGCDVKNFIIKQVTTISEVSTFVSNLLKKVNEQPEDERTKLIFVLDSLGNLTSDKELTDTLEAKQKRDMTKQQEIKGLFRVIATSLAKAQAPMIVCTHTYKTMDLFSQSVVSGGQGINYNSSLTLMLTTAKLDDKESEKVASEKVGDYTKTGVIVTATPKKSRFTIPQKVQFQIPFFKAPNPYVGLEKYLTWENSGIVRGEILTKKEYDKLSDADKTKCYEMADESGEVCYARPKDTARTIVVKHLGTKIPVAELWSSKVFTDELLHKLDEEVIKPNFELPSSDSFADVEELIDVDE